MNRLLVLLLSLVLALPAQAFDLQGLYEHDGKPSGDFVEAMPLWDAGAGAEDAAALSNAVCVWP